MKERMDVQVVGVPYNECISYLTTLLLIIVYLFIFYEYIYVKQY